MGWNVVAGWSGGLPSTLLGPETTGELVPSGVGVGCFWFEYGSLGSCHTRRLCWLWCHGCAGWVRPLLENCIVDASIFEIFQDCDRGIWVLHVWPAFGFGCVCGDGVPRSSWFL